MFDQSPTFGEKRAVLAGLGLVVAGAVVGLAGQILAHQPAYADARWRESITPESWAMASWWMTSTTWLMVLMVLGGFVVLGAGAAVYLRRSWEADAPRRAHDNAGPLSPNK